MGRQARDAERKVQGPGQSSLPSSPPLSLKVFPQSPLPRPGQPLGLRLSPLSSSVPRPRGSRGYGRHTGHVGASPSLSALPRKLLLQARPPVLTRGDLPSPRSIPAVPETPWGRRQVQGWQASTALGSVDRHPDPFFPSRRGGFQPRDAGSFCLQKEGCRVRGAPVPRGTSRSQSPRPPPELVPEVIGDLGFASSAPERDRCQEQTDPGHFRLASDCFAFSPKAGSALGTAERRGGLAGRLSVLSYPGALCGPWAVHSASAPR